jgi:hypothetical protein
MIVNWNKPDAGIKIIPAQVKDGAIIGYVTLLPGNNEVEERLWNGAKFHLRHDPERGYIHEVSKEVEVTELPESLNEEVAIVVSGKELSDLTLEELEEFLRENNLYNEALSQAKSRGKDFDKEFILSLCEESGESILQKIRKHFNLTNSKTYRISTSLRLKDLEANEALKVVLDTWNIDTLEKWRKDESRDEIRAAISNQIEEVNKPPRGKN